MNSRSIFFWLFLTYLFIFEFPECAEATSQADQLKDFIKWRKSWPLRSKQLSVEEYIDLGDKVVSNAFTSPQDGLMEVDRVGELPGEPSGVDFKQYAGYVNVDQKALFYYLVESPYSPSDKPLLLWLNGGPGCSSLGFGAMEEIGPFRAKCDGKTLERNKYAWNNVANVLFLESPAGVGFSYSNEESYIPDDTNTAADSYTFLINWFERFPHYKDRRLFIVGESYAGHYIPQLTSVILSHNRLKTNAKINLQAIAIGNAYVDRATNDKGEFEFLWTHALISDEAYDNVVKSCRFSGEDDGYDCMAAKQNATAQTGSVDSYNIYAPVCLYTVGSVDSGVSMDNLDPCIRDYIYTYLNDRYVQNALHARPTNWSHCSREVSWQYVMGPDCVVPLIKQLIDNGTNVWLYSGDVDSVVSFIATRYALQMLNLPIQKPWRAWYSQNQVGGFVVEYKGLNFVTVRGAGHEVPSYQSERALTMLSSFLQGKQLPDST